MVPVYDVRAETQTKLNLPSYKDAVMNKSEGENKDRNCQSGSLTHFGELRSTTALHGAAKEQSSSHHPRSQKVYRSRCCSWRRRSTYSPEREYGVQFLTVSLSMLL